MLESFSIKSAISSYLVEMGQEEFHDKLKSISPENVVIICDSFILEKYKIKELGIDYISVSSQESSKDISNISDVILHIKKLKINRNGLLIGIGGGVIQDLTCFIASIYMRGVKWIYLPTTFLGMCDSCIGGKSSINVGNAKNLVGNFYPPEKIIIDSIFCNTLPQKDIDSGMFEAIKILYAYKIKENILKKEIDIFKNNLNDNLLEIAKKTLKAKKWFIEIDELDRKERQLLNFGHCFGHAIESTSNYKIPHGIAVGLGMLWSIYFSKKVNTSSCDSDVSMLESLIVAILDRNKEFLNCLLTLNCDDIFRFFKNDKKHTFTEYAIITISDNGELEKRLFEKSLAFEELFYESFAIFTQNIKT